MTSTTYALNLTTDATSATAWYLLGGTHYLYHFSNANQSDPTDLDNGGVITTASAITYGLDSYWTWPCAAGTFSADGYQHGGALNVADPTCEVDTTGSCTIGTVSTTCPLAGYCPDACSACPSGSYLEVADGSFNKHFQHITQDTCALCPVGKWLLKMVDGDAPVSHDSLDDCIECRCEGGRVMNERVVSSYPSPSLNPPASPHPSHHQPGKVWRSSRGDRVHRLQ